MSDSGPRGLLPIMNSAIARTRAPDYGPFRTRGQAWAVFGGMARAARTHQGRYYRNRDSLTDTLERGAPLGDYDRQVLDKIAGRLDRLTVEVLCSIICRAALREDEWL